MGEVTRHDHVRSAARCEKREEEQEDEERQQLRRSAQPRKEVRHCAAL